MRVPTTLNVGSVDLLHPELFRGDAALARSGRELMRCYEELGCRATWTCAPYQQAARPAFGEHIAWAESNAIVFVNSVLGARTDRYGDFIDICAALLGRAPYAGLHRPENRRGRICFRLEPLPARLQESDILFAALGHFIGKQTGNDVPVIVGLEHASEDQLKALGAGAASSGSVALFHVVGVTPEAPTEAAAFDGNTPLRTVRVTRGDLKAAAAELGSTTDAALGAVSVGTPHFSLSEFAAMREFLAGRRVSDRLQVYVPPLAASWPSWKPGAGPTICATPVCASSQTRDVHYSDPRRSARRRDDELREVGVVRPRQHWQAGRIRQSARVRRIRSSWRGVA